MNYTSSHLELESFKNNQSGYLMGQIASTPEGPIGPYSELKENTIKIKNKVTPK